MKQEGVLPLIFFEKRGSFWDIFGIKKVRFMYKIFAI